MNHDQLSHPPAIEGRLDRMLSAWADRNRVTPAQANDIRQKVLERAADARQERSNKWEDMVFPGQPPLHSPFTPNLSPVYEALARVVPGWPSARRTDWSTYKPYLRVA